jgi:hypothetical protein
VKLRMGLSPLKLKVPRVLWLTVGEFFPFHFRTVPAEAWLCFSGIVFRIYIGEDLGADVIDHYFRRFFPIFGKMGILY